MAHRFDENFLREGLGDNFFFLNHPFKTPFLVSIAYGKRTGKGLM